MESRKKSNATGKKFGYCIYRTKNFDRFPVIMICLFQPIISGGLQDNLPAMPV
jgi:hypothetical protein